MSEPVGKDLPPKAPAPTVTMAKERANPAFDVERSASPLERLQPTIAAAAAPDVHDWH